MERQARWEVEGIQRGIERYREMTASRPTDETPPGQRLLRDLLPPLVVEIVALQSRAVDHMSSVGNTPYWCEPITRLSAVEWAVLTLKTAIRGCLDGAEVVTGASPASVRSLSLAITDAARDQIEFNKIDKAAKEAKGGEEPADGDTTFDLFRVLKSRNPAMTRAQWGKTRRRLEIRRAQPWTKETRVVLGVVLLEALIRVSKGALEARLELIEHGRTERRVFLSEATTALLEDRTARAEVARPLLMPMIAPPNDWRYEEAA